jgi:hypothetical protein
MFNLVALGLAVEAMPWAGVMEVRAARAGPHRAARPSALSQNLSQTF